MPNFDRSQKKELFKMLLKDLENKKNEETGNCINAMEPIGNKWENCSIETMIKTYLSWLKPNNFYYYKKKDANLSIKKMIPTGCRFKSNKKEYIGHSIIFDDFDNVEAHEWKVNKNNDLTRDSILFGRRRLYHNPHLEAFTRINSDDLNVFLETLGRKLYDCEYIYCINTSKAKRYGSVVVPLFFDNKYKVTKNRVRPNNMTYTELPNFIKYDKNDSDIDNKLLHSDDNILHPFGFIWSGSIHYMSNMLIGKKGENEKTFSKIKLNLSQKAKDGFRGIGLRCPC